MSRPLPADFVPLATEDLSAGRFITTDAEATLAANLHWALSNVRAPILSTGFYNDTGAGAGVQAYAYGGSAVVRATWVVPVLPGPWTHWDIRILASNTDGTNTATVRFERSDGTGANITVTAGAAAWTAFSVDLAQDVALATDVLRMKLTNPAAGEVRVHWVEVRPAVLSSIPASKFTLESGVKWCPIDSTEVDADSPLSVALRRREFADIEAIRQSRIETVVGWSDVANFRTAACVVTSGSYTTVLRVPFRAGPLKTKLRWGLVGYTPAGVATVRISTGAMRAASGPSAGVVATLPVGWTTPYAANVVLYSGVGLGALDVTPGARDELYVELTGTTATLMGLTAWTVDE